MDSNLKSGNVFNKILLILTDFSAKCDNAVLQALQMAEKLEYKVSILHVIDKQNVTILKDAKRG